MHNDDDIRLIAVELADAFNKTHYLIVVDPGGARYTNQVGGTACGHPIAQGHLIPFYLCETRKVEGWKHAHVRDRWWHYVEDAPYLESMLSSFPKDLFCFRAATMQEVVDSVKTGLIGERFGESWFPVVINSTPDRPWYDRDPWYPFRGRFAILTWENSD
jgi:hypothetical protein